MLLTRVPKAVRSAARSSKVVARANQPDTEDDVVKTAEPAASNVTPAASSAQGGFSANASRSLVDRVDELRGRQFSGVNSSAFGTQTTR
jgi:hypothetical protein